MSLRNVLLAFVAVALMAGVADAQRGRRRSIGGKRYVANGTFGLGLELGAPAGINGKYFLSDDTALNFGLGFLYDRYYYDDRDGVHLYIDHLWHPVSLANPPAFQLPFYVGVGARIWDWDDYRGRNYDGTALGVRVPFGLAFDFNNVPLDIFVQLTFVADLFFGDCYEFDNCNRFGPHFEGSAGIRYWFN